MWDESDKKEKTMPQGLADYTAVTAEPTGFLEGHK